MSNKKKKTFLCGKHKSKQYEENIITSHDAIAYPMYGM